MPVNGGHTLLLSLSDYQTIRFMLRFDSEIKTSAIAVGSSVIACFERCKILKIKKPPKFVSVYF